MVGIDKVIKGCKVEIESYVFDIDLIPFGHRSFDVIIGMDWLSNYKAKIIGHEKVVRIPLLDGKVLRVLEKTPEEKVRLLMSDKASDKKQEEIVVVRDLPEVFPNDLSGLPPLWEIEFRIKLIPRVVSIAKFPYRNGYSRDKNKAKNDKTKHKMEKIRKDKVIRSRKVKSQSPRSTKVNPEEVKVNPDKAKAENGENTT
nr:putative reverse transcriptase domain-containing protein [Tanacetum cinerariifolium]